MVRLVSLETQTVSWPWLKSISRELYKLDESPLLGHPPPFPWEKLSQELAKCFNLEGFQITPGELAWREKEAIMAGIATPSFCTQVVATGIDGQLAFWISRADVDLLMAKVLGLSQVVAEMQSEDLVSAFHRFLTIESIALLNSVDFDKRLSFKITSHTETRPEQALCQDVTVHIGKDNILCRLVITPEFRKAYQTFFLKSPPTSKPNLDEVQATVHLEAGRVVMSLQELYGLKLGDFVALDRVYYIPDSEKSRLMLTLNGRPLFRARLKEGSLKILEIPLQSEVQDSMIDKINPAAGANLPPIGQPQQPQTPPHEDENPFPDEEEDEDTEHGELGHQPPAKAAPPAAATPKPPVKPTSVAPTPQQAHAEQTGPLTPSDIPVQLVVEVGAITLPVGKILELAPGNLLDLDMSPENGVNLVVNGKIIGKAELLKIGESVGVRILEIGF